MNDKKYSNRAIFLDRDGVINKEVNYLSRAEDFEFLEGSIEALKLLRQKKWLLIVITNQAGIARGYFTEKDLQDIHKKMNTILEENGVKIDDIQYCPHHPEFTGPCECRKPSPGMILNAAKKFGINLKESYMVGDTLKDIETGINAKCKTILVLTGYGTNEEKNIGKIKPDFIFRDLLAFAQSLN